MAGVYSGWDSFLLKYGGEIFLKDEVSSVLKILPFCRSGGSRTEVVCGYMCLCCIINVIFMVNRID